MFIAAVHYGGSGSREGDAGGAAAELVRKCYC